jgi:hypothetical protein
MNKSSPEPPERPVRDASTRASLLKGWKKRTAKPGTSLAIIGAKPLRRPPSSIP